MNGYLAADYEFKPTAVRFRTDDARLQEVYGIAEGMLKANEKTYNDRPVICEGATFPNVWLETQPMGGEMYAKRNFEVGLNDILIFLQYQRRDGRFPGMIGMAEPECDGVRAYYDWLQGYYFVLPAMKMYYLLGENKEYLKKLYHAFKDFDEYLWSTRDSDGDGCLEAWCPWDTGEDFNSRMLDFGAYDGCFGGEKAPYGIGKLPYESMEIMAYSYANRAALAEISSILNNNEAKEWREKAAAVRDKVKNYLWDNDRHACYDRDCDNKPIDCLSHTNLRCMYHGMFTQEQADEFLYYHLFNPDEFWTYAPIPATAINSPFFHSNYMKCDWSGPCQGLIWQRAIAGLHNYGHYAEATVLGRRVVELGRKHGIFPEQWDPFTGEPGYPIHIPTYGPVIFAFLEYLSLLCGINISMNEVTWSNDRDGRETEYIQEMFGKTYRLIRKNGTMTGELDGKLLFRATEGIQVVTDLEGTVRRVISIDEEIRSATITVEETEYAGDLIPNGLYALENGTLRHVGGAKYFRPGTRPIKE